MIYFLMLYQNFLLSCLIIDMVCISYINYAIFSEYCTIHKMVAEGYDMNRSQLCFCHRQRMRVPEKFLVL